MLITCDLAQAKMELLSLDELPPDEGVEVQRHIDGCRSCQEQWKSRHRLHDLLDGVPELEPPAGMWFGVAARLQTSERPRSRGSQWLPRLRWSWMHLAAAGALTAVFLGGVWFGAHRHQQPAPTLMPPTTQVANAVTSANSPNLTFVRQHAAMAQNELFANRVALGALVNYVPPQ